MNRKTIRKYNKKYKTIRRAIRRTRKGGDFKDFRDTIFTKLGRQTQAKTEFKSLLRRMEKLQVFGVTGCDDSFVGKLNDPDESKYMVDILRENFNSVPNIDALIQLGLLYLKYHREWDFTSDLSDNADDAKNIKYKCVMNIGEIIGKKIEAEKELVEKKLLQIKEETEKSVSIIERELNDVYSSFRQLNTQATDGNTALKKTSETLLANVRTYAYRVTCIDEIIIKVGQSDFIDIAALSRDGCVFQRFGILLRELLAATILPARLEQSEGGSRRRRMNTHRRGKHTRRYKPKK